MARSTTSARLETYAGIDYHKKFSMVTLGDREGNVLSTHRLPNDPASIQKFFAEYSGLICTVESCRGYEWFVELLQSMDLTVHLCHAYAVKLIAQSRCKTDKIDSRILMQLLAKGFLPTCYQPTPEERALRERVRWRMHVVRNATRVKVRIHSLLDKENKGMTNLFQKQGRQRLSELKLASTSRQEILEQHIELLDYLESLQGEADKSLTKIGKESEEVQLLRTIPGVGNFSALVIIAELGNIHRFKRSAQVVSYAGLAPSTYSSGSVRRSGAITKQGSPCLRWILVQDAWIAIRFSEPLRYHFVSVSRRCGRRAAILSVARKLLQIAYRVLRDRKPFDPKLVSSQSLKQSTSSVTLQ